MESTGPGHVRSAREPLSRSHRSDKPANAPACVEVWSGGTITVDSQLEALKGEINADTAQSGGVNCCAWIDLFAHRGHRRSRAIPIGVFALHANQLSLEQLLRRLRSPPSRPPAISPPPVSPSRPTPRWVAARVELVTIEAKGNVDPGRRADSRQGRCRWPAVGFGTGGTVGARAFSGSLSWANLPGRGRSPLATFSQRAPEIPAGKSGSSSCSRPVSGFQQHHRHPVPMSPSVTSTNPALAAERRVLPRRRTLPSLCARCQTACAPGRGPRTRPSSRPRPRPIGECGRDRELHHHRHCRTATANSTNVKLTDVVPSGFTWTVGGADAAEPARQASPPPTRGGHDAHVQLRHDGPGHHQDHHPEHANERQQRQLPDRRHDHEYGNGHVRRRPRHQRRQFRSRSRSR